MENARLEGRAFSSILCIFVDCLNAHFMPTVQYVTDVNGKPLYVQLPIKEYEKLLAGAEELADITAYKKAKAQPGKSIPFDEAFKEIEAHHRKHNA